MSSEPAASLSRIAIVGMAGRFPGAPDLASFWRNLRDGVESVAFFTDEELIAAGVPADVLRDPNYVKARAVLDDIDRFDAGFFELTPREAELLDPQHRLFLQCAWHALEDAGYDPARIEGPVGVFAGVGSSGYLRDLDPRALEDGGAAAVALGNDRDFFATRISYKLNLSGPSLTIQTACSTSLVAVHLACQALLTAQCDMALAGGVCIKLPQQAGHVYQQGGIFTRDGHCRPFDAGATGTIGGSGLGAVVLKRLEDALADGDHIYALILASAVNNDGAAKVGYTAPSVDGQADAIALAHALAGVDAETIGFVEGHGTGTPLGDPIEIAALTKAFQISTRARAFCALGSVKSNVGHLDAAAGVAGLIKAVLALHHAEIPPTLHFDTPNPASTLADSPFYVNARLIPWPSSSAPRRAGVSSFGIGGTNAHLLLEQAPMPQRSAAAQRWQAITLSARSAAALDEATAQLAAALSCRRSDALADVAFTSQRGRRAFDHRRVIVARDVADLLAAVASADPERVFTGRSAAGDRPIAFLFPGQGAQQIDLCRALYESDERFRQDVDECANRLMPHLGLDLRGVLYPAPEARVEAARQLDDTWLTQPALFTIEYALARLWMRWGVRPRALIGHSIGEYVAACLADVMSLADALALIAARGKLVQSLPAGAMLAVAMAADEIGDLLDADLSVAAVNSPRWVVVSGTEAAVAEVERRVAVRQITSVRLRTARAFHSAMLDPILAPFEARVAAIQLRPPRIPILSNVTGTWLTAEEATAPRYWVRHMREPVRFADGIGVLLDDSSRVLLEVGPGRTLTNFVREHSRCDRDRVVLASQPGNATESDAAQAATTAAGRLWLAGVDVDWIGVHAGEQRQRVSLPGYPFERQRHWIAATTAGSREPRRPAPIAAPAASGHDLYLPTWTQVPSVARTSTASPHGPVLVFVDSPDIGIRLTRRLAADGRRAIAVTPASAFSRPSPDAFTVAPTAASCEQLCVALEHGGAWPGQIVHLRSLFAAGGSSSLHEAVARGFESVLLLAQALAPRARATIDLTLVSNGAYEVIGTEPLHPEAATLLGPLRVIPRELPHLKCRHIDLGGADVDDETIDALCREIAHPTDDDVIALRNGLRWRPGFAKAPANDAPAPLRRGGTYLITGGLGGVGLSLAQWLIETANARVALLGREGLPPRAEWTERLADTSSARAQTIARRIRGVQALEATGAEPLVLAADCLDREQMTQAIAAVIERFGALHGVIHAAGLPGGGLVALKTIEAARRVMAPKLEGTRVLADVLSGLDLDVVVLCSSLAGCLGGLGQVDYAAANAFLDAFAQSRRRDRAPLTIAIDWGAWRDVGMAANARSAGTPRATPDTGDDSGLSYEEATQAFARALALRAPRVAVSALPLDLWPLAASEPVAIAPSADASSEAHRHPRPDLSVARIAPRDETESALAAIWQDVLGIDGIGVDDDFSALGGHSLLATQIVARVRRRFGVDLPLRALFETPTVAQLAAAIGGTIAAPSPDAPIARRSRSGDRFPASSPQRRLWFLQQLAPDSGAYNLHGGLLLDGTLSIAALQRALSALVDRHEALRTTFVAEDGEPFQVVAPPGAPFVLSRIDLGSLRDGMQERALARILRTEGARPFDLSRAPLLRVILLGLAPDRHALLLVAHHCIADAWSMGIVFRELEQLYNGSCSGAPVSLPPLPIQYPDFAGWQRDQLGSERLDAQLAYWRQRLAGAPDLLRLPIDRPRPALVGSIGGEVLVSIAASAMEPLRILARQHATSVFVVLLAAFKTLLLRYTGQSDIVVGTPVAGRGQPELDGVVGLFVNTLALRTDLSGDPTFADLIDRVSRDTLEAYDHQQLPFDQLVEQLHPDRDLSHQPLFQTLFQVLSTPVSMPRLSGLRLTPLTVGARVTNQDLGLSLTDEGHALSGRLAYRRDLFEPTTARRFADHFAALVGAVARDPHRRLSEIAFLSDAERHHLLVEENASGPAGPYACVQDLFEAQVERTPYAPALEQGARTLTYDAVNRRANQLARQLQSRGVGPEVVVGLCVGRSWRSVVGLLAILKAGGTYLPLDSSYPSARLAFMLADAKAALLVTERALDSRIPKDAPPRVWLDEVGEDEGPRAAYSDENLTGSPSPSALAYVLYTSGSTGEPKGVMVPHRALVNELRGRQTRYRLDARDGVLQPTSCGFDISIWELLGPLIGGARLVLPATDDVPGSAEIVRLMARHHVTMLPLVTSQLPAILEEPGLAEVGRLRYVFVGGELLTSELQQRAFERLTDAIDHLYGPTETTIETTSWRCRPASSTGAIPIGRPIAGQRAHVLDAAMQPVPRGSTGELFVGGPGLARGYLGRPALTAERFVPDPFDANGSRLYRTGDLVRRRSDGALEFQGRVDTQVKVRGLRIELGEIEAALAAHADVTAAAAALWGDPQTDAMLVGYVVTRAGTMPSPDELRRFLRVRLPDHMVPPTIVWLEQMPLTIAGKIDRRALPSPARHRAARDRVEPRGELEQTIAALWTELLHVDAIGRHDSFFDLGGHSLLAMQVQARLRDACGVELSVRTLFDDPTVAGLAAHLDEARRAGLGVTAPPIVPTPRDGLMPCSFEQRRLWFLDRLVPGSAVYNVPTALRCHGRLDADRIARCVQEVVDRHEALRTTFVPGASEPFQQIHPSIAVGVPVIDLRALPTARRDASAMALVRREARRPFDLAEGPLLRVLLLQVNDDEQILFLNVHHIVCDGWSISVLMRELIALDAAFAAGLDSPLPPLPVQYADFARWQRDWLQGPMLAAQTDYWTRQLADVQVLELPCDRPRSPVPSEHGARRARRVPAARWQPVVRLARASKATPFMALHAALSVVLHRYTPQSPIAIGTGVSHGSRAEIEGLIGFFVNTVVLATDVSGGPSFRALLSRVRETALDAYAHQDLPFEMLVDAVRPERDVGVTPLFQVMLAMQDAPIPELTLQGLTLRPIALDLGLSKFDLMLLVRQQGGDLQLVLEYRTALFDHTTAERLLAQLDTLLARVVEAPDQPIDRLPLLGPAERHQIVIEWSERERAASIAEGTDLAHELFEDVARRMPAQPAVAQGDIVLSYGELSRRSNRLAHLLRDLGVGPETRVALCVERSADLIVAMLAVFKAGGAYIPFDPALPEARLRFMREDARPSVLIVRGSAPEWARGAGTSIVDLHEAERVAASHSDRAPVHGVQSVNLAYAIYTSGSTGVPKAVLVTHGGLANLIRDQQRRFGARPGDTSLQFASPSFDASVWEIWIALSCGATLAIAPTGTPLGGSPLADLFDRHAITHALLMTTTLGSLPVRALPRLRVLLVGGEAVPSELLRQWSAPGRHLFDVYGPTEATVLTTVDDEWHADQPSPPVIGRPLAGVRTYVLSRDLELLPIGAAGELCIGGAGVARGYLDRPALTADRFAPDPFGPPGSRLYRTGDRVRVRADGRLDFLGRLDQQVKLRGHRIELGEIEAALALHADVAKSVVGVRGRGADAALIAWWVPLTDGATTADDLRQFLRLRLPGHMIPTAFVRLDALPVNSSGKVDRRALPDAYVAERTGVRVAPRSELERTIAAVWRSVLGTDDVGVRDSFFDLGGHSLRMIEVHKHLQPLAPGLTLIELFEFPTIESLAAHLAGRAERPAPAAADDRGLQALADGRARLRGQARLRDAAVSGRTS